MASLAAALAVAGTGCADSEPAPAPADISGPPQRVARTVDRLERALRTRDFARICDELFTPAARRRAGGDACAARTAADVGGLRRPTIRLLSIRIAGKRADAQVRTSAAGRRPVEETIQLERSGARYRIAALAR